MHINRRRAHNQVVVKDFAKHQVVAYFDMNEHLGQNAVSTDEQVRLLACPDSGCSSLSKVSSRTPMVLDSTNHPLAALHKHLRSSAQIRSTLCSSFSTKSQRTCPSDCHGPCKCKLAAFGLSLHSGGSPWLTTRNEQNRIGQPTRDSGG